MPSGKRWSSISVLWGKKKKTANYCITGGKGTVIFLSMSVKWSGFQCTLKCVT